MKLEMEDGSVLEFENDAEVELAVKLGILVRQPTMAEKARVVLDAAKAEEEDVDEYDGNESVIPPAVVEKTPALMPKHVELPPVVFVTQGGHFIIEVLRRHPLGVDNKTIAELLRWTKTETSSLMSRLLKEEAVFTRQAVEKVDGHRRYRLTEFGRRCRYEIDSRPAYRRAEREPEKFGKQLAGV